MFMLFIFFPDLEPEMGSQRPSDVNIDELKIQNLAKFKFSNFQIIRPGCHFGVPKQRKVATNIISYKICRELLFQKVASGYLLHFVQDGSSKSALEKQFLRKNDKNPKIGKNAAYISP